MYWYDVILHGYFDGRSNDKDVDCAIGMYTFKIVYFIFDWFKPIRQTLLLLYTQILNA